MNKLTALHHKLCEEDPEYLKYVIAKSDSEAVEGSQLFDTYHATEILRRADASLSTAEACAHCGCSSRSSRPQGANTTAATGNKARRCSTNSGKGTRMILSFLFVLDRTPPHS
jgi:hypothetical protein